MAKGTVRSRWDKFNAAPSWKALILGAAGMFLADNGIDKLLDRFAPQPVAPELVRINERLDRLQESVDRLWQIKGQRRTTEPERSLTIPLREGYGGQAEHTDGERSDV